ncbi:MAG: DNA repair and recombination protein RadA [Nanoarchaeota archaeon]|nr:DNA repair and recombination protein RadA [Nanoarchaeota archaeon]
MSMVKKDIQKDEETFEIEDIPGVGSTTARKLREAGFEDAMGIATASPAELAEICEIGEATARKIINAARSHLKMDFISGTEMLERMKKIKRITTGSKALNQLIGGGIETQAITEAYGQYGSGKSQLAFQLAVNVQLPEEKGGLNGAAAWIDTEGTFRPSRVIQIAKALGLNPNKVLENIKVARAYSADHQILLVEKLPELFKKFPNIKLIIVDSLTSIFRSEYVGRGTLAERQQKLNKHIHALQRLADRYNVAVYVTNQVMARPDIFFGDPTAAVGGNVIGHASTYRIYLRHSKGDKRVARLVDSPCLPEGECVFRITEEGIKDVD